MILKRLLIVFISLNISVSMFSQAGSFLTNSLNARNVAMGSTFIAFENNNSVYSNLAANSMSNTKFGVNFNYRPWINDLSSDYNLMGASVYYAIDAINSFALGFKNYTMPSYSMTDDNGNSSGTYQPGELSFALGYARKLDTNTAVSLTMQYLASDLYETYNASTLFVDLGLKSSWKKLNYGVIVKNLGPNLNFDNKKVSLPRTIGGGIAYSDSIGSKNTMIAAVDFTQITQDDESGISSGIGFEYAYDKLISLRAGYHFVDESIGLSALTLGAGINYKGASVDFGYLVSDNALNNNYSISFSFNINKR